MYCQLEIDFEFALVDTDSELDYKSTVCRTDSLSKN